MKKKKKNVFGILQVKVSNDRLKELKRNWPKAESTWNNVSKEINEIFDDTIKEFKQKRINYSITIDGNKNNIFNFLNLTKEANDMMNEAKKAYKNIVVEGKTKFYQNFNEPYSRLLKILDDLNSAIGDYFNVAIGKIHGLAFDVYQHEFITNNQDKLVVEDGDDYYNYFF